MSAVQDEEKTIRESKDAIDKRIRQLEEQIATEQARVESHSREKRDRANARLQEINALLTAKEAERQTATEEHKRLMTEADAAMANATQLENEQSEKQSRIVECDEQIRRCAEMEKSKLAQYGMHMEQLLDQIRKMQWHGQPPVGPFGLYVKVKDDRWSAIMRQVIGGAMSNFAITDARDRPALYELLQRTGKYVVLCCRPSRNTDCVSVQPSRTDYHCRG